MSKTLYRCSGYVEEICGDCEFGKGHNAECCGLPPTECFTHKPAKIVHCIEYDRNPCGDPKCPDCTGGDGVSCK